MTSWEETVDYRKTKPDLRQVCMYFCAVVPVLFLTGMLFYRSSAAAAAACLLSIPLYPGFCSFIAKRRKDALLEGFRDALYSISSSVSAGRQIPSAIDSAAKMSCETRGDDCDISAELLRISRGYEVNHADIGVMLEDLAVRSDINEIRLFSSAFRTCQLCGGDLEKVCLKSSALLLDKMSVNKEVQSMVKEKKIDIILLTAMPFAVLALLNLVSYNYVSVLYESTAGRVVMSICLLLMASALLLGLRITKIEL